jgi:hypothetical protein
MEQVAATTDAAKKGPMLQEVNVLKGKMVTFGALVLVLQIIAAALMAVGHYI